MARSFKALREKMPQERQRSVAERVERELEVMALKEMRQSLNISQSALAAEMGLSQGSLSKLENRTDMLISSVRRMIAAMGGELVILARFQDRDVRLDQLSDLHAE